MVTDFQGEYYNKVISYYDITYSEVEDEMTLWILDFINDLKSGVRKNSLHNTMAMCIYDTLISLSGDPDKDYLSYESMNKLIYNFNKLTHSTISINFR